jgi:hypothetical protein
MALKLLQPGLQPAGQFDLVDGTTLVGGEWVNAATAGGSELAAADVTQVGPLSGGTTALAFAPGAKSAAAAGPPTTQVFGGLADEGTTGYGTSFGTVIGAAVGKGTGFGTLSTTGVVTVGPQTTAGSGKVTVWHAPGLYGVSGSPATAGAVAPLSGLAVNVQVYSNPAGNLGGSTMTSAGSGVVGIALGAVRDTSLVSTTATAAGESAQTEFYALYLKAL